MSRLKRLSAPWRLLAATTFAVSVSGTWMPSAHAADFTKACEANSALDSGKLSDADKKSCECIKAKLDDKTRGDAGAVLEKLLAQRKAGKGNEKPDMSADEQKAMGAFVSGMQGCVATNQ